MSRKTQKVGSTEAGDTKAKRIAISATAAGVLLVVFLVIILVIQFVKIGVKNAEKSRLQDRIDRYERLSEETERDIEFYKTQEGLRMLAVMNGWKKDAGGK